MLLTAAQKSRLAPKQRKSTTASPMSSRDGRPPAPPGVARRGGRALPPPPLGGGGWPLRAGGWVRRPARPPGSGSVRRRRCTRKVSLGSLLEPSGLLVVMVSSVDRLFTAACLPNFVWMHSKLVNAGGRGTRWGGSEIVAMQPETRTRPTSCPYGSVPTNSESTQLVWPLVRMQVRLGFKMNMAHVILIQNGPKTRSRQRKRVKLN